MPSLIDIDNLLVPVVTEVIQLLQLMDANTNQLATTDEVIKICARNAYHQITAYVNRDFITETRIETYSIGCGKIHLKNTPVSSILNVWTVDSDYNEELLSLINGDYTVVRSSHILINSLVGDEGINAFLKGTSIVRIVEVIVEYIGGYALNALPTSIMSAFSLQTLANYNRIVVAGLYKVESERKTSVTRFATNKLDSDSLIPEVLTILEPYRYYGDAMVVL